MNAKLKIAIITSGKHQYEIASLAGMSENYLTQIVTGRIKPSKNEQKKLEKILKTKEIFDDL
jgi:transcriptional regulator with XRE-family HTH domain